jgi:hypothetical protein
MAARPAALAVTAAAPGRAAGTATAASRGRPRTGAGAAPWGRTGSSAVAHVATKLTTAARVTLALGGKLRRVPNISASTVDQFSAHLSCKQVLEFSSMCTKL